MLSSSSTSGAVGTPSPVRLPSESQIVQYDHSRTGELEAYLALIQASPRPRAEASPFRAPESVQRDPAQSLSPQGRSPLDCLCPLEEPELFDEPNCLTSPLQKDTSPLQSRSQELPWLSFDKIVYEPTPPLPNAPYRRGVYEALPSPLSTPVPIVVPPPRSGTMNPKYILENGAFILKEFRQAFPHSN